MDMEMPVTNLDSILTEQAVVAPLRRPALRFRPVLWTAFQLVLLLALAVGSYFFISRYLLQSVRVVGESMEPTLQDTRHYLLNRWIYSVRSPHRADIVVLRDPADNGFSVKRVVAVAGDSLYLKDGDVYLNGRKIKETYLAPGTPTYTNSKFRNQLVVCGRDQYFLLGDNRMNSADSRTYGPVPRGNILGLIVH